MGLSINDSMWAPLIGFHKEAFRREARAGGMWRADEEGIGLRLEKVTWGWLKAKKRSEVQA